MAKTPTKKAIQHAHAEGLYKTNKVRGNPRAGKKYIEHFNAKGQKVHSYFDKSGNTEKAVVVKGAADEAAKRVGFGSKAPATRGSLAGGKKPRNRLAGDMREERRTNSTGGLAAPSNNKKKRVGINRSSWSK